MHRLSELDWLRFETGNVAVLVPEMPAETNPDESTEEPTTRRITTIGEPVEFEGEAFPLILGDARDPDEDEEEDELDYLYDDDDDDLDDDADDDLEDFDDEEEEFEDEDEEL
jgi:hypothetical protein